MIITSDEGFTNDDIFDVDKSSLAIGGSSIRVREEIAYRILSSLPRSRLAGIQRRIAPLLQFDLVGSLPTEISLQIFSCLSSQILLNCALVSRRWRTLADDQSLWKNLCNSRGWEWKQPSRTHDFDSRFSQVPTGDSDDEGMGDDEDDEDGADLGLEFVEGEHVLADEESGFASMDVDGHAPTASISSTSSSILQSLSSLLFDSPPPRPPPIRRNRHSAPSILPSLSSYQLLKPNYKRLHQTHRRLSNRFHSSSYRLSLLQNRGTPTNAHTNTIYCLQLYTYPSPSTHGQTLFTGSKDRTIREWNLTTGCVERVIKGVHECSVLSICVSGGFVASGGSDRRVVVWDLEENRLVKVICDHEDSVLCVRFDEQRLVSCSKDRTVRTYSFPDLVPQFVLGAHRAAVNAVSLSKTLIVSGSGDRSIRLWDAQTGKLLRTFENHHSRGIASIDFSPPFVISGSSDKHLRLFDITTLQGWSTSPDFDNPPSSFLDSMSISGVGGSSVGVNSTMICHVCGSMAAGPGQGNTGGEASGSGLMGMDRIRCVHADLVRSVALGEEFVLSGSYDLSIKVWERSTGKLVADLTGGHTGRIFCIGFDCTKIVSCGEDQRICIWDFSHGIDTSFIKL
ncbi:hypothetical protein PILCRDRAFT_96171 [Piloderma croceum F 1598]|uniref:F-box domain-containing protein n=1 Tax=Piloderma croceum (strain F 1598) TaxID=765440 RepID=A0A0C3FQG8_PILCF|nr:hypothetical protein PILCRDRAFT_96171 [Piloderma croceum F 1598]